MLSDRERRIFEARRLAEDPVTLEQLSDKFRIFARARPPDRGARLRKGAGSGEGRNGRKSKLARLRCPLPVRVRQRQFNHLIDSRALVGRGQPSYKACAAGAARRQNRQNRSVAQPGSAPRSGRGGRRFKSSHSDQTNLLKHIIISFGASSRACLRPSCRRSSLDVTSMWCSGLCCPQVFSITSSARRRSSRP